MVKRLSQRDIRTNSRVVTAFWRAAPMLGYLCTLNGVVYQLVGGLKFVPFDSQEYIDDGGQVHSEFVKKWL